MQGHDEIEILGNVGGDAEMRYTPTGTPVTSFTVAVNKKWKDPNGEQREKTKWFRVTCWRKQAEFAAQYVFKGQKILVKGEIDASAFTDRDGKNRASLELTASRIIPLEWKNDGEGGAGGGRGSAGGYSSGEYDGPSHDDDLPF